MTTALNQVAQLGVEAWVSSPLPLPPSIVLDRGTLPAAVVTLVDVDSYDPASGTVITNRWSDRELIYPDNTAYRLRLMSRVEISQSGLDSIGVGGRAALTLAQIRLYNDDRAFDAMIEQGLALGRRAVVKTMPAPNQTASDCGGGDLAAASTVFTGVVAAMTSTRDGMVLSLSDLSERLNVPLQAALYDGLGGLGGSADLIGKPKPVTFGFTFNVTPVYIGLVDLGDGALPTYQSHWRQIVGHSAMREHGVVMTQVFTAPGIGQWRDWPLVGCFQIGFTPAWIVTCDCSGDAAGGVYAATTARIIERLLTSLGPILSAADLEASTFDALDLLLPGEIGWRQDASPIQAADAVEQLLAHSGVWLAGGRNGKLRVSLVDILH